MDVGDLADQYLPSTRHVDYPPDSLGALSIQKKDDRYQLELSTSYEALHRRWSSSYQNMGTGRTQRARSYATFWSKELSLAALEAETGFSTLTSDRAQSLLKKRRTEYRNTLQIDVYWFEQEGNTLLAGPGTRVELKIGDETYRPIHESHGPLREAFLLGGGGGALYRYNTFSFPRTVDGNDILERASGMALTINQTGLSSRVRFSWEWPSNGSAEE